jgi:hypothetical protein
MLKMEKYCQNESGMERKRIGDVYVPSWAQTLIDLYTSPLKYEVVYGRSDTSY